MIVLKNVSLRRGTKVLLAELDGVGREYPLSIEKLCPVLSFYVVRDWQEGCERCKQILRYGGMGHTMSIHSRNEQVILEFGLKKPANGDWQGVIIAGVLQSGPAAQAGMRPGDVLIQCGTSHSWDNRSDEICRVLFVMIDAQRRD